MITYIASYPRSGNTMVVILLRQAFAIRAISQYDSWEVIAKEAPYARESPFVRGWKGIKPSLETDERMTFVKTHDPPEDGHPAIYIVRDPRAALVSYWHFLVEEGKEKVSLDQVIAGSCAYGSWSDHVRVWSPLTRPHTLVLRYEDLLADGSGEIARLSRFLNRAPSGKWDRERAFERGHAKCPGVVRRGSNAANFAELSPAQSARICELCRDGMMAFRYPLDP